MITDAITSTRPCPKGCLLSGGRAEPLAPQRTIEEVKESDRVCQASAIMAIEAVVMPTQYFKPNRRALM